MSIIRLYRLFATKVILLIIVLLYEMGLITYSLHRIWISFLIFHLFLDPHTVLEDALYDVVVDRLIFMVLGIVAHLCADISKVKIWILIRG